MKAKGVAKMLIDDLLDDEQSFDFESSNIDKDEEHFGLVWWFASVSSQHGFGLDDGADLHQHGFGLNHGANLQDGVGVVGLEWYWTC